MVILKAYLKRFSFKYQKGITIQFLYRKDDENKGYSLL